MNATAPASEQQADRAASTGNLGGARDLLKQAIREVPGRMESWMKLAMVHRALGETAEALGAIAGALRIAPLDFGALLTKAHLLDLAGRADEADLAFGHALAQKPDPGRIPSQMAPAVAKAEERYGAYQQRMLTQLREAAGAQQVADEAEQRRLKRFCTNIARTTRVFHSEPTHFHYPHLVEAEFHDEKHFPWIAAIEAATDDIRAELQAVLAAEAAELVPYIEYPDDLPLRQWKELNRSRDWTAIHLLRSGERIEANTRHCPRTMELLRTVPQPEVPGRAPNAMFSLLAPHTRIPPHNGVDNSRLVVHLPLIVPPDCGFRCGAETRQWEEGRIFVFDDTIEHEAWNDSDELRVVLIFDTWHWGLSETERRALPAIMTATQADASGGL